MSKITQKKLKALDYFTEKILDSPARNEIAKMILFGSLARGGKIHPESDVDVLIFSFNKPYEKLKDIIDDASYDTLMKYGESVEPLIYSFQDYKYPKSVFLFETTRKGKEIYSVV